MHFVLHFSLRHLPQNKGPSYFHYRKKFPPKKTKIFLTSTSSAESCCWFSQIWCRTCDKWRCFLPFLDVCYPKTHLFLSYFLIIIGMKLCPCAVTKILSSQTPKPTKSCLCKRATLHVHRPSSTTLPPIDKYEHCLLRTWIDWILCLIIGKL